MSISEKQLKANRENAKKGGVKTQKGKAISRFNATKHAMLLSVKLVIPGEDIKEFLDFQGDIVKELQPSGVLEDLLVDRFIACAWRLRRILSIESMLFLENYGIPT